MTAMAPSRSTGVSGSGAHGDRDGVDRLLAEVAEVAAVAARQDPDADRIESAAGLRVGVDLGTASCVLVVLATDPDGGVHPLWVGAEQSGALRDGVVVDFARAAATVGRLKRDAEHGLGLELSSTATAYPPCIPVGDARACRFVCEAAGFDGVTLVDEVSAAQRTLGVVDGVVVDVGGGSTGVGVFRGGELVALDDRPGGGHHLDLILAGALGIGLEDAEPYKRTHPEECAPILVPGLQRIAENVRLLSAGAADLPLHLAGGALMTSGAGAILADYLERTVVTYPHALLITPVGIAKSAGTS